MAHRDPNASPHTVWKRFRFAVVGPLLACPPERGELKTRLRELARRQWQHPVTGEPVRFALSTIERWFYQARRHRDDPIGALGRRVRSDHGQHRSFRNEKLTDALRQQYTAHRSWSYKLHHDNLEALLEEDPTLAPMPSYSSLVRFMKAHGLMKVPRSRNQNRQTAQDALAQFERREVRLFEMEHVGALWHFDFHHASRPVLDRRGQWLTPIALAILDDHSRLACHVQWYQSETAEDLVHGLSQGFQKRGCPRATMSDNGSAMKAQETLEGLDRLSILHEFILPYCPNQNGKQEKFWDSLEGRLLSMLERKRDLTLDFLNHATQAWVEFDYNRKKHEEIGERPLDRFVRGPDVSRFSPSSEELRLAFRCEVERSQRVSDGTLSIEGVRFEVPSRYRHLRRLSLRYARWNLGLVHLVDPRTGELLSRLYPVDKTRNADGRRRRVESPSSTAPTPGEVDPDRIPPLLRKLLAQYAATGAPPAYIPKPPPASETETNP